MEHQGPVGFFRGPRRRVFSRGVGLKCVLDAVPELPALTHDVTNPADSITSAWLNTSVSGA